MTKREAAMERVVAATRDWYRVGGGAERERVRIAIKDLDDLPAAPDDDGAEREGSETGEALVSKQYALLGTLLTDYHGETATGSVERGLAVLGAVGSGILGELIMLRRTFAASVKERR